MDILSASGFESRHSNLHKHKKKALSKTKAPFLTGELGGIRTRDPLIKSQMLYRLSYEPKLVINKTNMLIDDKKALVNKKILFCEKK